MAVATVIDKGSFETGLDAGDFTLVYVGFFLASGGYLDIKIVELLAIHHGHTQLFGLRGID